MALYRLCSRCGQKVEQGSSCPNGCMDKAKKKRNKVYDQRYRKNSSSYNNGRWRKLTADCKNKFHGLDIYQYYMYGEIVYGDLSHHIETVEECPGGTYDLSNLIYVRGKSHGEIHRAYERSNQDKREMQKLLFDLVKKFEDEF